MALPVTVYRWDDAGAPQVVDGSPSEYMNVIKKCLVEGYGSKSPLGWTVEQEIADPPVMALKNDTTVGSGGVSFFRADSNNPGDFVFTEGCNDYVDKDNRGRKSSYFSFNNYSSNTNSLKRWFLIGTAKAYYFFVFTENLYDKNHTSTLPVTCFFQGDFESLYPNDPATFVSISGILNSTSFNWATSLIYKFSESSLTELTYIHPLDGSDEQHTASLVTLNERSYVAGRVVGVPDISLLAPYYLMMGKGRLSTSSDYQNQITPFVRGILPGAFLANSPGYRDDPKPVIKNLDNDNHFLIPSANSHTGCVWINLQEW